MDKKFAIFDMDGTLVDSMAYWKGLASEYLERKGISPVPAEILEQIRPMTMTQSGALFQREFGLAGDPAAEMNAMMAAHYIHDIPLKPGVAAYLDTLCRRGVRMCVASATAEHLMAACLERLGVLEHFEFLLSCETVGAGKDSPAVYDEAARRLGSSPAETAVYEDALYAARTAKDAGFYVVGVRDNGADWAAMRQLANEVIQFQ